MKYNPAIRNCQEIFSYISILPLNLLIIIRIIVSREAGFLRRIRDYGKVKVYFNLLERKAKEIG
jgi:hypothetical protein